MKRHTLYISAFVAMASLAMTSCDDYLDIEPPSQVSPETYFTTADQLGAYIINYYNSYGNNWNADDDSNGGQIPSHGVGSQSYTTFLDDDQGTDNEVTGDPGDRFYSGNSFQVGTDGGKWKFGNINNLNFFIETVEPKIEAGQISGDINSAKHYLGEGYFLRALEYYYRLRKLGDFPIVKTTLADNREQLIAASQRQPRNKVARFILEDLDKAISLLTDGQNTGGRNRITKDVAYLLKARVALYEGTFEKYHAGTPFVPDKNAGWPGAKMSYNKDFTYDNAAEVKFFLDQAMAAAKYVADKHELTTNSFKAKGTSMTPQANPYYDMFIDQNSSKYDEALMYRTYDYSGKSVSHSVNAYKYKGQAKGYTQEYANTFLMLNGLPIYAEGSGYAGDDFIDDTKKNRDWRWQLFMKAPGEYVYKDQDKVVGVKNKGKDRYVPVIYQNSYTFATTTGYLKGKGFTEDMANTTLGQDVTPAIIFRAAEAYLIYLEASCEENNGGQPDATAMNYWKKLRARAGITADPSVTVNATDLDKEWEYTQDLAIYSHGQKVSKWLYNIRRERRDEFISEGFRMDDLIRWRSLDKLKGGKYFLHGCKVFGPMKDYYRSSNLKYDQADDTKNNVSSPNDTEGAFHGDARYMSLFRKSKSNKFYNEGMSWHTAHYLYPIAEAHFTDTSADGVDKTTSPIYQNPGWSTVHNTPAEE